MTRVEANGLQVDCEVHGEPGAPVILLVMGLGMPAALWPDPVVQTLTGAGFRVVTFDNRDAGGSTRLQDVPVPNVLRAIWRALRRRPVSAPYTSTTWPPTRSACSMRSASTACTSSARRWAA